MTPHHKVLSWPTSKERYTKTRHRSLEQVDVGNLVLTIITPIIFTEIKSRLLQAGGKVGRDIDLSDVVTIVNSSLSLHMGYAPQCGIPPDIRQYHWGNLFADQNQKSEHVHPELVWPQNDTCEPQLYC